MPMITKDLNYTRHNSGSGGVFSVSTSGTNLTHKWYKNDKPINRTGAGILEIGNDSVRVEDSNGLLRITYEASNVDYENMTQTARQTFGLYTSVSQDNSATIALGVLVAIETLSILILAVFIIILCFKCRVSKAQEEEVDKSSRPPSRQQSDDKESLTPMQRIILSASSLVRDCETNFDFLHCLTMMLTDVLGERDFDNECTDALTTMRDEMEKLKKSRKPPREIAVDGTGKCTELLHVYVQCIYYR